MYTVSYGGVMIDGLVDGSSNSWIHLATRPSFPSPEQDVTEYVISGRDSNLVVREGTYRPIDITLNFSFKADDWDARLSDFYWWLFRSNNNTRKLYFFSSADAVSSWYYQVLKVKSVDVTRETKSIGKATVVFTVDPYKYDASDHNFSISASSTVNSVEITNPSRCCTAKPYITVRAAYIGTIVLYTTSPAYHFTLNVTTANVNFYIDTEKMIVYRAGSIYNGIGSGDYECLWIRPGGGRLYAKVVEGSTATVTANCRWRRL